MCARALQQLGALCPSILARVATHAHAHAQVSGAPDYFFEEAHEWIQYPYKAGE